MDSPINITLHGGNFDIINFKHINYRYEFKFKDCPKYTIIYDYHHDMFFHSYENSVMMTSISHNYGKKIKKDIITHIRKLKLKRLKHE